MTPINIMTSLNIARKLAGLQGRLFCSETSF
jgi:hypothetical protein